MEDKVLQILVDVCEDEDVKEDLDANLFENDFLDSLAFTELLVAIEEELGIVISPSEVTREDVETPNKIISLVKSKA
ncbi:MAG: D-alanine--poly(phosphoribitol) ligase subunit DltC [Anaerovoracaceae bacterium]